MYLKTQKKSRLRSRPDGLMRNRRRLVKLTIAPDVQIDYKNLSLVQKYVTDRGKILPRRLTGILAKQQRDMVRAIQRARYLGLVSVGSSKKRTF